MNINNKSGSSYNEIVNMKDQAVRILNAHGCELVDMVSECTVIWKNKAGIIRTDDIAVLSNMSDSAWEFWSNN